MNKLFSLGQSTEIINHLQQVSKSVGPELSAADAKDLLALIGSVEAIVQVLIDQKKAEQLLLSIETLTGLAPAISVSLIFHPAALAQLLQALEQDLVDELQRLRKKRLEIEREILRKAIERTAAWCRADSKRTRKTLISVMSISRAAEIAPDRTVAMVRS